MLLSDGRLEQGYTEVMRQRGATASEVLQADPWGCLRQFVQWIVDDVRREGAAELAASG